MKTKISRNLKKDTVVTIGNFDGLHKGHLELIKRVTELKVKYNLYSVVLTFNVNTKGENNLIFPQNQLKENLAKFDIDYLITLDFLEDVKELSCENFVKKYIVNLFKARYVVVGENFFFGKEREGDAQTLKLLGEKYNFKVIIKKSKMTKDTVISSTLIRGLLRSGEISYANRLMCSPFYVWGIVKKGFQIGSSKLKVPTANISIPSDLTELKNGVYVTKTTIGQNEYKSITNVGIAPIKPKQKPVIETYILDFDEVIYSKRIKVTFIKYIRSERKFESINELQKQIIRDVKVALKGD